MRRIRVAVILFFVFSCICYGVYEIVEWKQTDRNMPVIHIEEDVLAVSAGASTEELLAGVTATDEESGDLTDRLQIASMSPLTSDAERTVRYIVFDDAGQLGTASRTIVYKDYISPRIYLKEPLRFAAEDFESRINELEITASDCIDGDISMKIRMSYASDSNVVTGQRAITFQVNNSAGDTCVIPVKMTIVDEEREGGKYYPMLTDYIVYTQVGRKLDPESYLQGYSLNGYSYEFDIEETEEDEAVPEGVYATDVLIESNVKYNTPGVYSVDYSYTSSDNITAVTTMYVVVEE